MASTWTENFKPAEYPALDRNIDVDALVIGGGITGTTAAYCLAKAGVSVALVEKTKLAETNSAYTTAFITHIVDTDFGDTRDMFGIKTARNVWVSHAEAIDMIEKHVRDERIECEFMRCNDFLYGNDEEEWKELSSEADLAAENGFAFEKRRDGLPIKNAGYVVVPGQAKFHPLKYLNALRARAKEAGGLIYESTEAKAISGPSANGTYDVLTTGGTVKARKILIATYDPWNKPAELFAHKGIYTSYVIEMKIASGILPEGIYEDQENPYHYLRIDAKDGYDRAILGGEDHRHEIPLDSEKAYASLGDYFTTLVPGIEYETVVRWSGPIIETADGLAYIGTYSDDKPGVFVATGFSGNGMTYGTMAGKMFAEFARDRDIPWKGLYDPKRPTTVRRLWKKGKDYVEELARGYGKTVFKDPESGDA